MIQETGRGQAFPGAAELKLGIRKGDPNLAYFSGSKIVFQSLDLDPQKSEIFHLFLKRGLRTTPQSRSLDIDADEVLFRHFPAQVYSIFTAATAQFQNKRIIIREIIAIPPPLKFAIPLKYVAEPFRLGKIGRASCRERVCQYV